MKRLYVQKRSGGEDHHTAPLYFANARVLLTISQLLSSASTPAFIWFDNGLATPSQRALRPQVMPAFGLMNLAEILAYWSLSHCFMVTVCYGHQGQADKSTGPLRYFSPSFINCLFILFPLAATAMTTLVVVRVILVTNGVQSGMAQLFAELDRGSTIWAQNAVNPQSPLQAQLTLTNLELKRLASETNLLLVTSFERFRFGECTFLFFSSVSCLIFVALSWVLLRNYQNQRRNASRKLFRSRNSQQHENTPSEGDTQCPSAATNISYFNAIKADRQFFHLNIRAMSTFIAMLINIAVHLIAIIRTADTLSVPYWRGIVSCLAAAGSTFSGIPIAWQCWRLYTDHAHSTGHTSKENFSTPEKAPNSQVFPTVSSEQLKLEFHLICLINDRT